MRPHGTAGPSADGTFLDFLGIVAQVSDTPEEPEDGAPGPGEGGGSSPDEPEAPLRGWIDPDDRLWRHPSEVAGPGPAPDVPSLLHPPPGHNYRSAVMVLVGVGAVMAVVAWVIVLLSPASDHPLDSRHAGHGGQRAADHAGRGAERAARRRPKRPGTPWSSSRRRPRHGRCCSSASPWPRAGSSPPPPTSWAACAHLDVVGPGGKLEAASVVAMDKASDVALVNVPEDLPVAPFADDTDLDSGDARPRPHLRAGRRPRHCAALHARAR